MEKKPTEKILWLWQNSEKILSVLFLATFTFNIRKVFLTPYSFLNGSFNEYMTISFGWGDLLALAVIIIYIIKTFICQLSSLGQLLSILRIVIRYLSNVIRTFRDNIVSRETIFLFLFFFWIAFSVIWSDFKIIAVYRLITFVEISIFSILLVKTLSDKYWCDIAILSLILNGVFQSFLSIAQFIHNGSIGFFWLGESVTGTNVDGVAKLLIDGEKHIRSYGTTPHPNILAAFLIIPAFILISWITEKLRSNPINNNLTVSRGTLFDLIPSWVLMVSLFIVLTGLFLTFSRSAFLGFVIGLIIFYLRNRKMFRRTSFFVFFIKFVALSIVVIAIFLHWDLLASNGSLFSAQTIHERALYQNVARETISKNPALGVGIGQFVFQEFKSKPNLEGWKYQPVHNVYLLVFSELGFMGFISFVLFLLAILKRGIGRYTNQDSLLTMLCFYCIVIPFLFMSLFDHYFWDIKIGMLIFAVAISFILLQQQRLLNSSLK